MTNMRSVGTLTIALKRAQSICLSTNFPCRPLFLPLHFGWSKVKCFYTWGKNWPSISPRIQNKVCLAARTQSVDAFEEADIDGDAAKCICEMAASPPTLHHHPPLHHCHSLVHQLCALNLASHSTSQRGAAPRCIWNIAHSHLTKLHGWSRNRAAYTHCAD